MKIQCVSPLFRKFFLKTALLSVSGPAAWVSTEHLSIHIHPSYLNFQPQCAASRASTITMFHLQQLRLNPRLSAFIVFLRLSLSVLITVDCCFQVFSIVLVVVIVFFFLSFPMSVFSLLSPTSLLSPSLKSRTWLRPLQCHRQKNQALWLVGRSEDAPILGQKEAGIKLKRALRMFLTVLYFSDSCNMSPLKNQHMWFH